MVEFIEQQGTLFLIGFSFFVITGIIGLNRLQRTVPSPVNKLILRWIRLICVGVFFGLILKASLLTGVPFWRLSLIGILLWVGFDSLYLWIYISAWDRSEFPLFPEIRKIEQSEWPANKRFFWIRDWIRQHHYEEIGAYKYYYQDEVLQQVVIFECPDKTIRLQVLIVPDATGVILDQIAFTSITEEGLNLVTDNVFMPFGGVYPENWKVVRHPAIRKIEKIAQIHQEEQLRIETAFKSYEGDPLDWLQEMQREMEVVNVEYGLLNERQDRVEFGKMTGEGRYRVWKELLVLNYFSKSLVK